MCQLNQSDTKLTATLPAKMPEAPGRRAWRQPTAQGSAVFLQVLILTALSK